MKFNENYISSREYNEDVNGKQYRSLNSRFDIKWYMLYSCILPQNIIEIEISKSKWFHLFTLSYKDKL